MFPSNPNKSFQFQLENKSRKACEVVLRNYINVTQRQKKRKRERKRGRAYIFRINIVYFEMWNTMLLLCKSHQPDCYIAVNPNVKTKTVIKYMQNNLY